MQVSLYWGTMEGAARWRAAVERHARWLGASVTFEPSSAQGRRLDLARLRHGPATASPSAKTNAVALTVGAGGSQVQVSVPLATPQQCLYAWTPDGLVVSDDLRLFPRLLRPTLDQRALYALFAFGAIPPDLTVYREVRRAPGGHSVRFSANGRVETVLDFHSRPAPTTDQETAERRVGEALDATIAQLPPDALLYFSGGVDSSLLAARAVRTGRRDLRLVNYRFANGDEESALAERVARHFGFALHHITFLPGSLPAVLERIGSDYSFPFGDCSAIPTNLLVHGSLDWGGDTSAVVEGTGADGAFGVSADYSRYRSVHQLAWLFRLPAYVLFRRLRLWQRHGRLERAARFLRRSVLFPLETAVLAQNALDGIAYALGPAVGGEVQQAVRERFEVLSNGAGPEERLSLMDVAWVCAGRMAPKSFDPLRRRGVAAVYPYLEPALLEVSASLPWTIKGARGESKALLKTMLARELPHAWVYRPKSGFTPPYGEMFASAPLQDFLRGVVLSGRNPALDGCRRSMVADMIDTARRRHLSSGAYDFLWSLAFVSAWLAQAPGVGGVAT